jgi:uncharacterized cupin superfamily protein
LAWLVAAPSNVWDVELEAAPDEWGAGVRGARMLERSDRPRLVSAVWELDPGSASPQYHAHHATEEMVLVLRGTPVLRTPDGERTLAEGELVHFPIGAAGAHQLRNDSSEPVRYLMIASHNPYDAVEYIDEARVVVYSAAESALLGKRLFFSHDVPADS